MSFRHSGRVSLFILLLLLSGCAQNSSFSAPEFYKGEEGAPLNSAGAWLLRHRVVVEGKGKDIFAFDGLLRLESTAAKASAAGFALMTTLFVMDVNMREAIVRQMHPRLRRMPGIERDIAACIRALWMNRPSLASPPGLREEEGKDFAPFLRYIDPAGRYAVRVQLVDAAFERKQ